MMGVDFEPSEETQAAQQQIEQLLARSAKQLEKTIHLNYKQVQLAQNLPLFVALQQWVGLLVGDVLRHMAEEQAQEASVLLPEDAEGLLTALEEVDTLLGKLVEGVDDIDLRRGPLTIVAAARARLAEVAEAINELTVEEEEDEEDEEDLEFVEDHVDGQKPEEVEVE